MTSKMTLAAALISIFTLAGCGGNETASQDNAPSNAFAASAAPATSMATVPAPRGEVSPLDSGILTRAQWTGAACSLDTIDGSYSKDQLKLDRAHQHTFRGWLLDEAKQPAGKFSLVLRGSSDYAISASTGEVRKDVGEYFKNAALSAAGFSVSANLSAIQVGDYDIVFVIQKSGRTFFL